MLAELPVTRAWGEFDADDAVRAEHWRRRVPSLVSLRLTVVLAGGAQVGEVLRQCGQEFDKADLAWVGQGRSAPAMRGRRTSCVSNRFPGTGGRTLPFFDTRTGRGEFFFHDNDIAIVRTTPPGSDQVDAAVSETAPPPQSKR